MTTRTVLQHPTTKRWAFVELSDEDSNYCIVIGDKDFETEPQAWEHAKGFTSGSYTWKNPTITALNKVVNSIEMDIADIQHQLEYMKQYIKKLENNEA